MRLRFWALGSIVGLALVCFVAYQQQRAAQKYAHHRAEYCAALVGTTEQKKACVEEHTSARDYLPWGYVLVAWPDGIGAWAIILTGVAIAWQSYETRQSALFTAKSVDLARRQFEMVRDKDRARIEIKADSLEFEDIFPMLWGNFRVRNLGETKAYIEWFQADIVWHEKDVPVDVPPKRQRSNVLHEIYLDPTRESDEPSKPRIGADIPVSTDVNWFCNAVFSRDLRVLLGGICEYRTVGSTYQRTFLFEWVPKRTLSPLYDNSPPHTNGERIACGKWEQIYNEETEVEPNK